MNKNIFEQISSIGKGNHSTGAGVANGSFGELLQGISFDHNRNFLITLPINLFSFAKFTSDPSLREVRVHPAHKTKSKVMAEQILADLGLAAKGHLLIQNEIPEGKGMASSSADLVATARAISDCFETTITARHMESVMRKIEPSDGVMYPGVVSYFHRDLKIHRKLGRLDDIRILGIDQGGTVDTVEFNKHHPSKSELEGKAYDALLKKMYVAFARNDLREIGRIATTSAILNQHINPKKHFLPVYQICIRHGGLGVVTAHSGTMMGILLRENAAGFHETGEAVLKALNNYSDRVIDVNTYMDFPDLTKLIKERVA